MKRLLIITFLVFIGLFTSCKKDNIQQKTYEVSFNLNTMSIPQPNGKSKGVIDMVEFLKSMSVNPEEVTNVTIGIDGTFDNPLIEETQPYSVSSGVTQPIQLSVGNHNLTKMVLSKLLPDGTYEILYSAVGQGSYLSQFVPTTIPLTFSVPLLNQVPVNIDVVAIDSWTPEQFGWAYFNLSFTTVNEVYYYGADDNGNQSNMVMTVYKGSQLISTSTQETEGWIKVLYPDVYNEPNSTEIYTFKLLKDGVQYSRNYTVEELLSLPREVILLNVFGSGMAGFNTMLGINMKITNQYVPGDHSLLASYVVKDSYGIEVWNSGDMVQGTISVQYPNGNPSDIITIIVSYRDFNQGPGTFYETILTKTANVTISQIQENLNPFLEFSYGPYSLWYFN